MSKFDPYPLLASFSIYPIEHALEIVPFVGVGPIRFGAHRDEVEVAFTYAYQSFFKNSGDLVRSDHCQQVGLIVHYDHYKHVCLIETAPPQNSRTQHLLFGSDITHLKISQLKALVRKQGAKCVRYEDGYEFPSLGLRTFNSHFEGDSDIVEGLIIEATVSKNAI